MSTPTMSIPEASQPASDGFIAWARSCRWLPIAVLCGVTLAFYHGLWLPGLVLIKRDAFGIWLPIKQHMIERLSAGDLPQWFPYEGLGRPFIGTAATGVFHPFTALYFILPAPDAYRASTLLSCLLAAFGAFALGRTLNFSRAGALVAGVSFALSGFVVSFTEHLIYLYSICVLPFFCAALEKALVGGRAWTVAPAVVWATVLLHGDGQTGYYYGFIALIWMGARAPGAWREAYLRLLLVGCLAALLAGVQLAPAAAVFLGSHRMQPDLFHGDALFWSTHPLRLLTMLAAPVDANVNPSDMAHFFFDTPKREAAWGLLADSLYLGVPVMGLAFIGAWQRRDLRVLTLLGCVALLLALGRYGGLYDVFYNVVPLWSAFRFPEKFMGVVSFAAAMLAGAGLDALRAGHGRTWPWFTVGILCASAWLGLRTETVAEWTATAFGAPAALAHEVASAVALAFLFSAGASLGTWIVIVGARKERLHAAFLIAAITAIVMFDLTHANLTVYRTAPAEAASFIPPLAEALRAREGTLAPGRFRLVSIRHATSSAPDSLIRMLGDDAKVVERRQALDVNHNATFHLESPRANLPGFSRALITVMQQRLDISAAARLNVAYYIGQRSYLNDPRYAEGVVAILPDYDLALFRNPIPAKPRAYLSLKPERTALPVDPAALHTRPDFLSGEVDVIETLDAPLPEPAIGGSAAIERYAPEEVQVLVETPQPAVLILLDAFDKGWTAALESGTALPILRANALVRAVVVPAGRHIVAFRYETPLLQAGAMASLAGVICCLTLIASASRRSRESRHTP